MTDHKGENAIHCSGKAWLYSYAQKANGEISANGKLPSEAWLLFPAFSCYAVLSQIHPELHLIVSEFKRPLPEKEKASP